MERLLADLRPGDRGRVVTVEGDAAGRLRDMGLIRGTPVEVIRTAPFGDPMEVRVRGFMLTLRRAEAAHIRVE